MFLNIWLFLFCTSQAEYPVPGDHMVQVGNKMDEISNLRIIIKDEIFFLVNLKYAIYHVCGYGKLFFKGKGAKFKKDWKLISSIEKFFIEKTDNPHLNTHDNTTYNSSTKYYRKLASIFNKIITFFIKNYNFMQTYDLLSEYTIKITEKTAHNEITEHIKIKIKIKIFEKSYKI